MGKKYKAKSFNKVLLAKRKKKKKSEPVPPFLLFLLMSLSFPLVLLKRWLAPDLSNLTSILSFYQKAHAQTATTSQGKYFLGFPTISWGLVKPLK